MKKMKKLKQVLVTSTLLLGMLTIGSTSSQAALQANAATHASGKTASGASWIQSIREMEASGQTMGLNETINTSTLVATSSSNNIDVHMMKSTEYGSMAILSASGFGYSGKLQDAPIKSTTGNVTGVYVPGNRWEWTAGVCSASTVGKDARYYDLYTTSQVSAKVGDALGSGTTTNPGCTGWHGGSAYWLYNATRGFLRGNGGIFSFDGRYSNSIANWASNSNRGRGVAVVGTGL